MALKNESDISTIAGPEFINLEPLDINPLMSKCQIKVFYLGHNRNGSYINREVAEKMSKTLRGTPIVAAYNENKEDFGDHGHIMHIEDGEVTFSCKTIPYGFVSPNAEIWFQNFVDTDEFDNSVERTYLMTEGYLWDGQFQELKKVLAEGQPQSMELDTESMDGHWATDSNLGVDFFIINDAVFSKLCILGDDVEPCFEGSSVTASPEVEKNFANAPEFSTTLFSMMNDLTEAINSKGGLKMPNEFAEQTETVEDTPATEEFVAVDEVPAAESEVAVDHTNAEEAPVTDAEVSDSFDKKDDDDGDMALDDEDEDKASDDKDEDDEEQKPANNHSLEEFEALTSEVESLRAEIEQLREFKLTVENEQKDALIESFPYNTLSKEDIADVVAHKSDYSLDEIKSKLAVIYVEKGVQFTAQTEEVEEDGEDAITSFSLDGEVTEVLSPMQEALRKTLND